MNDTWPCTCGTSDCTGLAVHTEPDHATVWGREIRTMTAGELGLCGKRDDA